MDTLLVDLGFVCLLLGIIGNFLPVVPGVILCWVGLLVLHLTETIPLDLWYLGITLGVVVLLLVLDYVIPALGVKKFGGSTYSIYGAFIGFFIGIFSPIPLGVFIGPFIGAYAGEMYYQKDRKIAVKAAIGSVVGLFTSAFFGFIVGMIFLGMYLLKVWEYRELLFTDL